MTNQLTGLTSGINQLTGEFHNPGYKPFFLMG